MTETCAVSLNVITRVKSPSNDDDNAALLVEGDETMKCYGG